MIDGIIPMGGMESSVEELPEQETEEKENQLQGMVVRLRKEIIGAMLKHGTTVVFDDHRNLGKEIVVTIPPNANVDRDGNIFVKTEGMEHSLIVPPEKILNTPEGTRFVEQFVGQEPVTAEEKEEVMKRLLGE
jgi:hypothetical protein